MSASTCGQQIADEIGAVQFFAKPFDVEEVITAIQRHARR